MKDALDIKHVETAWAELNRLVPIGPITSDRDYDVRAALLDTLVDTVGDRKKHPLSGLLDVLTRQIEEYDDDLELPEASPADVLRFLMEQHGLTQSDLGPVVGGQSVVSAILKGEREINVRQAKSLAARFGVSPAVFI